MSYVKNKRCGLIGMNGKPLPPKAESLDYGEIAINYAVNNETIFIKNSVDDIVGLPSHKDITKAINDLNIDTIRSQLSYQSSRLSTLSSTTDNLSNKLDLTSTQLDNLQNNVQNLSNSTPDELNTIFNQINNLSIDVLNTNDQINTKADVNHTHSIAEIDNGILDAGFATVEGTVFVGETVDGGNYTYKVNNDHDSCEYATFSGKTEFVQGENHNNINFPPNLKSLTMYGDCSNINDTTEMFNRCNNITSVDISGLDTTHVSNMELMFGSCGSLQYLDLSSIDTSSVTNMLKFLSHCYNLRFVTVSENFFRTTQPIPFDDAPNLGFNEDGTDNGWLKHIAETAPIITDHQTRTINLSTKITQIPFYTNYIRVLTEKGYNVELLSTPIEVVFQGTTSDGDYSYTFDGTSTEIASSTYVTLNLPPLNTNISNLFYGADNLVSLDLSQFNTSSVSNMSGMFSGCSGLTSLDVTKFNTSSVSDMSYMFDSCRLLTELDLSSFNTANVTNMGGMFNSCNNLNFLQLNHFNTLNVTNMSAMFANCSTIRAIGLSNFRTHNVTSMSAMFDGCALLESIDVSNFHTFNVTEMGRMFADCATLTTIDLSNFQTDNVRDMQEMFSGCQNLTSLYVSKFNTSNVENMSGMFSGCQNIPSLELLKFDTSKVSDMSYMFYNCSNYQFKQLNLSSFDTHNVRNMSHMFANCSNLAIVDLTNFDTSSVLSMDNMFKGCANLRTIRLSEKFFNTRSNVISFEGAPNLGLDSFGNDNHWFEHLIACAPHSTETKCLLFDNSILHASWAQPYLNTLRGMGYVFN